MNISLIVAADEGNGIGFSNTIPWYFPDDLKYFKSKTEGNVLIMGRKTYDSIGKPLPNRKTIVVTSSEINPISDLLYVVHSQEEAIKKAEGLIDDGKEIFIAGGSTIYNQFLPLANKIYITRIHKTFICDTWFPNFEKDKNWKMIQNDDKIKYSFQIWSK